MTELLNSPNTPTSFEIYMEDDKMMSNQELYQKQSGKIDVITNNQKTESQKIDSLMRSQHFLEEENKRTKKDAKEAKHEVVELNNCLENLKNVQLHLYWC